MPLLWLQSNCQKGQRIVHSALVHSQQAHMKHFLLVAIVTLITLMLAPAGAQAQSSRLYFAGYLGLNTFGESGFSETTRNREGEIEFKNAFSIAGALGLRLTPQWRIEGEISRRNAKLNNIDFEGGGNFKLGGEIASWLYMMNFYYDIDWAWKDFQPFLTAGLGFAAHEAAIYDNSGLAVNATDDTLGFAFQLGGGMKYRLNPDTALTGNYRYIGANDLEIDSYDLEYTSHEWRIGLEYDLPMGWLL